MKKLLKTSLLLGAVATLGMMNTNAKTMNAEAIEKMSALDDSLSAYGNVYIMGKYVFVENVSAADIMEASDDLAYDPDYLKEYRSLFNSGRMNVIYKDYNNEWINATKASDSLVSRDKISIEMTHLIAMDDGSDHISTDESLYNSGEFVSFDDSIPGRIVELFVDQKADLSIASIKATNGASTYDNTFSNDTHAYNTKSLSVEFRNNALKLTENAPLLKYNNGTGQAEWIGLIIKTNKQLGKTDSILMGTKKLELLDASAQGGDANDYLVWVKAEDLAKKPKITVHTQDENKQDVTLQEITLEYTASVELFTKEIVADEAPVINTSVDVKAEVVKVDDKYVVIFYTDEATDITNFEYSVNDDKNVAYKTSQGWDSKELIQVLGVEKATISNPNDNQAWNQNAITIEAPVEAANEDDPYDYVVNIHHNKGLYLEQGVLVNVDLSVSSGITANGKDGTPVNNTSKWTVTLNAEESIVTFENTQISDHKDLVRIKFVLIDETPALNVNIEAGSSKSDIYPETDDITESTVNAQLRRNLNNVTLTQNYDDDTQVYDVKLKQNVQGKEFERFVIPAKAGYVNDGKVIGTYFVVLVDLGVDPAKLTYSSETTTSNYYVANGKEGTIAAEDITNAKRFGTESDTAFMMWVNKNTADVTFKYSETNQTVKIVFTVNDLASATAVDVEDQNSQNVVNIAEENQFHVSYEKGKGFVVTREAALNNGKFVATTTTPSGDTKEYTYEVFRGQSACSKISSANENTLCVKKVENLHVVNAYNFEVVATEAGQYNRDSYKTLSINGNVINLVFKRNLNPSQGYMLVLDLGALRTEITDAEGAETANGADRIESITDVNVKDRLVGVWLDPNLIDSEEGEEFKFVHKHSTYDVSSEVYTVIVKSTIEDDEYATPELKTETTEEVVLNPNSMETTEYNRIKPNQDAITTRIDEQGRVVISYDKKISSYCNVDLDEHGVCNGQSRTWFGVLVDLGIDPTTLGDSAVVIDANGEEVADHHYIFDSNERSAANVEKFGGSGTQFILWLDSETFDPSQNRGGYAETDQYGEPTGRYIYTLRFNQGNNKENQFGKTVDVTFILEDNREELTLNTINTLSDSYDVSNMVDNTDLFRVNQDNFKTTYDSETKTVTISPVAENKVLVDYKYNSTEGKWFAIEVDFGKEVSIPTGYTYVKADHIEDSTKVILWVNCDLGTTVGRPVFTDVITGKTFNLNVKYVSTFEE